MTEDEWLECADLNAMLTYLGGRLSARKRLLFVCACCRRLRVFGEQGRDYLEAAEWYADGTVPREERKAAARLARRAAQLLRKVMRYPWMAFGNECALLREVCGNPFRPARVDSSVLCWNGGCVTRMAQAIYDGRRFDDLPILADALDEAGCREEDVLAHCRSKAEHVRGCWVLDALLGKA